jgi:hypothetical protein
MQPCEGTGPLQAIRLEQPLMLHDLIPGLDSSTQPGPLPTSPMFAATVNSTTPSAVLNTPRSLIATVNTPQSLTSVINTPQSHATVIDVQPLTAAVNAAQPQLPMINPVTETDSPLPQFQSNMIEPHSPPSNGNNYMELTYQGGEAKVDRGDDDDIGAEIAASKKKKSNDRKNQYYGNRTQPLNLWAKTAPEIVEKVDQMIRDDPKLGQSDRISLLNSHRQQQWKELPDEEQDKWTKMANEINSHAPGFGDVAYVLHTWQATYSN